MDREIKVWGQRWLIRRDSTHATSFLVLHRGHGCSWHSHQTKHNLFVVTQGSLEIRTKEIDGSVHAVTLKTGECLTVRAGVEHQFYVPTDVEYDESDIIRTSSGF